MSTYTHKTPPDESKAPCYPERRQLACALCLRHRSGLPLPVDMRQFPIIDASLFIRDGVCGMYEPREVVRPYSEPADREAMTA